jgi:cation transport regulator
MPYDTIDDLPLSVRRHLPAHAQEIYRSAFNAAWHRYAGAGPERREQITHRIAWAAVKRSYGKVGDDWVPLTEVAPRA